MRDFLGDGAPSGRTDLFKAYMAALCPTAFKKTDFLGKGSDAGGKADYQGCSKFNPLLIFSQEKNDYYSQAENHDERNAANQPNRRVLIYLFSASTILNPAAWPCPRASESGAGCHARFFSDADDRRAPGDAQREYRKTRDTFACRFYDRFARRSPCEVGMGDSQWLIITLLDMDHNIRTDVPYELKVGSATFKTKTNDKGRIAHLIPAGSKSGTLQVDDQMYNLTIEALPPVTELAGVQLRLTNLGYDCGDGNGAMNDETHAALSAFQELHKLDVTGDADDATSAKLKEVYGH
jgi:hypothetical protein